MHATVTKIRKHEDTSKEANTRRRRGVVKRRGIGSGRASSFGGPEKVVTVRDIKVQDLEIDVVQLHIRVRSFSACRHPFLCDAAVSQRNLHRENESLSRLGSWKEPVTIRILILRSCGPLFLLCVHQRCEFESDLIRSN